MAVTVKMVEGTMGVAIAGPHAIVVDRSLANGGTYRGMVGGELLFSAIGTCLMTTLIGAARARDIELKHLEFEVSGEYADAPSRYISIDVEVTIEADVDDAMLDRLLVTAERACTVSNSLRGTTPIFVRRRVLADAAV